jgi:predicted NBD/HSP70 family sugar kinase
VRLGIDIGGTKTAVVVLDRADAVVASATAPSGRGPDAVVARAAHLAQLALAQAGGQVDLVGACIPGLVDPATGMVRHAVNLDIEQLDLAAALGDALAHRVTVENDVKAAALGAHHLVGAGPGETLALLNLGTGLAAAVVHDGQVLRGSDGAAGEIGHLPVGGDVLCPCGQAGCLETLASGSALERMWPAARVCGWDLFGAVAREDAAAERAAESLVRGTALAVQLLVLASGAGRVVISGGLTALGRPLLDGVREELDRREAASPFLRSLALGDRITMLGTDVPVAAIGAARLAGAPTGTVGEVAAWRS